MQLSLISCENRIEYGQLDQVRPCLFSFGKRKGEELKELHWPVLCRDFLNDTLVKKAKEVKPRLEAHRYTYNGSTLDLKEPWLIIRDWQGPFSNLEVLKGVETELGIDLTEWYNLGNDILAFKVNPWWLTNTVKFSWLTTLLRGLSYNRNIKKVADIPQENWMRSYNGPDPFSYGIS